MYVRLGDLGPRNILSGPNNAVECFVVEKEESSKQLSDVANISLVDLRLRMTYQSKFDNSSDTADQVWEHVRATYNKLIATSELRTFERVRALVDRCPCSRRRGGCASRAREP